MKKRGHDERIDDFLMENENSSEDLLNIEREHHRMLVWIIDDNADFNGALQRSLKSSKDREVDFTFYEEGEKALSDFKNYCEMKGQLPAIILIDYNLEQFITANPNNKPPKYRTGVEVIEELGKICKKWQVPKPELIAYSTDKEQNARLEQAGANSSLDKSDSRKVTGYLKGLAG